MLINSSDIIQKDELTTWKNKFKLLSFNSSLELAKDLIVCDIVDADPMGESKLLHSCGLNNDEIIKMHCKEFWLRYKVDCV